MLSLNLLRMLADPSCPQGSYLTQQTEETLFLLKISEGEPADEAFAPASEWMFKPPEPAQHL
jgi:hypothetical protein